MAYSLFPLTPWLIVLSLLALKPNRKPAAWWILVPCALMLFGTSLFQLVPMVGNAPTEPLQWLYVGFAVVLLLTHRLRSLDWIQTSIAVVAAIALVGIVCPVLGAGLDFSSASMMSMGGSLAGFLVVNAFIFIPLILASFFCRNNFTRARFVVFYVVAQLVLVLVAAVIFFGMTATAFLSMGNVEMLPMMLMGFGIWILVLALSLLVLLLPFFALSFLVPFYGERFEILFNRAEEAKPAPPANLPAGETTQKEDMQM